MGSTFANDLASNDLLDLDLHTQIEIHLRGNHYPPVPVSMVQPCIDAIDAYNDNYDTNKMIDLPEGVTWRGADRAPAWALIDAHHLESWLVHAWDCDCSDCIYTEDGE